MQRINEKLELTTPFDIRSDPRRRQEPEPEPELHDPFADRLWWLAVGYASAILIIAAVGLL